MDLPPEGTRINLAGHLGTVRFSGTVDNASGVWLGIEWDDLSRGKHDGIKDSKRYFTCRIQNAGSFIRPSAANLSYGRSFLDALVSKYVEVPHGSESQEKVLLGSSNGAIVVEAVRLDKIRGKLADLNRLREVSLDNENVARCDTQGAIRSTCPNIRGLDLSTSLLKSWDDIASIARELLGLRRLALNRNRLQLPTNTDVMVGCFATLTELQLNGTLIPWDDMQTIITYMPRLRLLEMGYNHLAHLGSLTSQFTNPTIEDLNLESNQCSEWVRICNALHNYTSVQRVVLASNGIGTIPFPENGQKRSHTLKHISLSYNKLNVWSDVDALSSWCPGLETLTLNGNPLMDFELGRHARPLTISRIPSLLVLDGAAITPRERTDSELFYLSHVTRHGPKLEEERVKAYPQWQNLCAKHGTPDEPLKRQVMSDKLSNRLVAIGLYSPDPQKGHHLNPAEPPIVRVLPTMTLKTLRLKIRKVMKSTQGNIVLQMRVGGKTVVDLPVEDDLKTLDRLGLDDGSDIVVHIQER